MSKSTGKVSIITGAPGGRILLTGAGGFVGRHLANRLLADGKIGDNGAPISSLTLVDISLDHMPSDPRLKLLTGDLTDPAVVSAAVSGGVDVLYHLASVPGSLAERDPAHSKSVNVDAMFALLDAVRAHASPPRVVYTSTIAVYGAPMPDLIDDHTALEPSLTYGVHKLMMEGVVADYTKRGWIDGRTVRLPGIVARPRAASGLMSAFLSDVFTMLRDGETFVCPVTKEGKSWFLSVTACIDHLIHAASIGPDHLPRWRAWNLPAQRLSMGEIVDGIADVIGAHVYDLVTYEPTNPILQANFASYPPYVTQTADRLGFRHDGTPANLVRNALAAADQE